MTAAASKKQRERAYFDEARKASALFPEGRCEEHERPDFLLHTDDQIIGVEITELCNHDPRATAGRLANVVHASERQYRSESPARPMDVVVAFSPRAEELESRDLTRTLLDVVAARQGTDAVVPEMKNGAWQLFERGFLHVGVHDPLHDCGRWAWIRGFHTTLAPEGLLRACIEDKDVRVADYRRAADEVWLLIINDMFLGPGEVYVRPDDLAQWAFPFSFDKVLVFSRQPGGSGTVFELLRA
jgi:hypothetical protein